MILLAVGRPADPSGVHRETWAAIRDDLLEIRLSDCELTKAEDGDNSLDNVPIMRCAFVLQALVANHKALSHAALACFYSIVAELGEIVSPTWSGGAARANPSAQASAFITGECARALLAFENTLLRTADLAQLAEVERKRIVDGRTELRAWQVQEEAFRAAAFHASLSPLWLHLAIEIPDRHLRDLIGFAATDLRTHIEDMWADVASRLDVPLAGDILSGVAAGAASPAAAPGVRDRSVAEIVRQELRRAARQAATSVLTKLVDTLTGRTAPLAPDAVWSSLAGRMRAAAAIVHDLLEPVGRFAESVIDRELAHPELGLTADAAELVFAATLCGRLSGWQQPRVGSAFRLARKLFAANGRLPSVQPFNVMGEGYRLNVAVLESTRRLAELAARVEAGLDYGFVRTLMRPFEDTRAPGQEGTLRGWMAEPRGSEARSEWWVTALSVDALGEVVAMLDLEINRQVLAQFQVRQPSDIKLDLAGLFYPDHGLAARRGRRCIETKLQALRLHAGHGPPAETPNFSLVVYGPPGTGKTTLIEAVAKSAAVPLVEITPSDILVGGEEAIERRARHVFLALSMLTHVVILFDEFDPILQDRAKREGGAQLRSIFEFLTPGMLPKLKRLHESAKDNRVSYTLATNFVYDLDPAAIRQGRFDEMHGIYPPDPVSRLGRLLDQQPRQKVPELKLSTPEEIGRAVHAVSSTAGGAMDQIATPGWFSAKRFREGFPQDCLFRYIAGEGAIGAARQEAKFEEWWPAFVSQKMGAAGTPPEMHTLAENKTRDEVLALIDNEAFLHFLSERERSYWEDWGAIYRADEAYRTEFGADGPRSDLADVYAHLARWVNPGGAAPAA
jgi:hypothetical protein